MMTKKEQAAFEDLQRQLREAKALRFTEAPAPPDVAPPQSFSFGLSKGWVVLGDGDFRYLRIEKACSSSTYHGYDWTNTSSQMPKHLYSARLLALRALRHQAECFAARELAKIDKMIEDEIATPTPGPEGIK